MKRRKSRIILGTTAVAAALTFGGCSGSQNTSPAESNTAVTAQENTAETDVDIYARIGNLYFTGIAGIDRDYQKAIGLYERSFELEPRRPRFQDDLMAIAEIYEIQGEYRKAAETYDRIIDLLENEWGLTEEVELQVAKQEKARLIAKA